VILVVEYDPAWPVRYEQLRQEYAEAMAAAGVPVVSIEHVGSTAVPGLAAKPVIDCDIVVAGQDVAAASHVLCGLGFVPLGELGIPLRWAFKEPERLAPTNTYVVVQDSLSLRNHLAVRDILRADPGLREQYAAVKRKIGAVAANIDEYGSGKNAMVQQILAAAGLTAAERASIDAATGELATRVRDSRGIRTRRGRLRGRRRRRGPGRNARRSRPGSWPLIRPPTRIPPPIGLPAWAANEFRARVTGVARPPRSVAPVRSPRRDRSATGTRPPCRFRSDQRPTDPGALCWVDVMVRCVGRGLRG
jgi:GrpB-like predicted nucleotidyltransferase (UPF0157 family)